MLDGKDQIIFECLLHDCRISTTQLAKLTNLTQPAITYRIRRLEKGSYIGKYDAVVDFNKLPGALAYFFVSVPRSEFKAFERACIENSAVAFMLKLLHKYQYWILLYTTKEKIKKYRRTLDTSHYDYRTYSMERTQFFPFSIYDVRIPESLKRKASSTLALDQTDAKLIEALCDGGGRDSILQIAQRTNLTSDVALYRFRKLKDAGYFAFFHAQPGMKFHMQQDVLVLDVRGISFDELSSICKRTGKIPVLTKVGDNKYVTQIFSTSFEEYKDAFRSLLNAIGDKLVALEVFHTDKWVIMNRLDIQALIK